MDQYDLSKGKDRPTFVYPNRGCHEIESKIPENTRNQQLYRVIDQDNYNLIKEQYKKYITLCKANITKFEPIGIMFTF